MIQSRAILRVRKGCSIHVKDLFTQNCKAHCGASCIPWGEGNLRSSYNQPLATQALGKELTYRLQHAGRTPLHTPRSRCIWSPVARLTPPSQWTLLRHSQIEQRATHRLLGAKTCATSVTSTLVGHNGPMPS
jgi:hypothetical protein